MIQKIKKFVVVGIIGLSAISPVLVPSLAGVASASISSQICDGANSAATGSSNTDCTTNSGTDALRSVATQIVNIFSVLVGVVAVIMVIYGGFKYITSGGESGNITSAKNTLIYAIVGLLIVALAQFIVRFVLHTADNTNLT